MQPEKRLTTEQRLRALERGLVLLHDELRIMHGMIKELRGSNRDFLRAQLCQLRPGRTNQQGSKPDLSRPGPTPASGGTTADGDDMPSDS